MIIPTILSALAYIAALAATFAAYGAIVGAAVQAWAMVAGYDAPPDLSAAEGVPMFLAGLGAVPLLRRFDRAWARFADWWTR